MRTTSGEDMPGSYPARDRVLTEELPELIRAERLCAALEEVRACMTSEIDLSGRLSSFESCGADCDNVFDQRRGTVLATI